MARILCVTGGMLGLLYSSLELARRLEASGHRVTKRVVDSLLGTATGAGGPGATGGRQ